MAKSMTRHECALPPEAVFDFLIGKLGEHEFTVGKNQRPTLIEARAPETVWSWGASISFKISGNANRSMIEITAKRPELLDVGNNNKTNLLKMQALLRLAERGLA